MHKKNKHPTVGRDIFHGKNGVKLRIWANYAITFCLNIGALSRWCFNVSPPQDKSTIHWRMLEIPHFFRLKLKKRNEISGQMEWYCTNPDFPEIAGDETLPKSYLLGGRVFGRDEIWPNDEFRAGNPTMIPPSFMVDFPNKKTRGKNAWQEKKKMQRIKSYNNTVDGRNPAPAGM